MTCSSTVSLWTSCHAHTHTLLHTLVQEDETVYFMLLWAQGVYTEIHMCICLVNWEIHKVMVGAELNLLAMQQMPALPEQSSYLTCRPQRGSVCPRPGWTWRSTAPSCWWSGRYIGLWREANWKSELQNNPQWPLRKVHSSCLKFKDSLQLLVLYDLPQQAASAQP